MPSSRTTSIATRDDPHRHDIIPALRTYLTPEMSAGRRWRPDLHPHQALALAERLAVDGRHVWVTIDVRKAIAALRPQQLLDPVRHRLPEPIATWATDELSADTSPRRARRLLASLLLIEHFDRPWRRQSSIPLIRVGGEVVLLCQSKAEASDALVSARRLPTQVDIGTSAAVAEFVDLSTDQRAHCYGFGIRLDVRELELTVDERGWRQVSAHIATRVIGPFDPEPIIRRFVARYGPALPYTNTRIAYGRFMTALARIGCACCRSRADFQRLWRLAYRRWQRLREGFQYSNPDGP